MCVLSWCGTCATPLVVREVTRDCHVFVIVQNKKSTTTKKVDVLQFGKISKGNFSLDYRFPVSPIQAFGVFLSAFSFRAVDKKAQNK